MNSEMQSQPSRADKLTQSILSPVKTPASVRFKERH
jgi:hypothetical protein